MSIMQAPSDAPAANDRVVVNMMIYPGKRSHKKSRGGCTTCKARKVKCDETRPSCNACRMRETECTYPPLPEPKPRSKRKSQRASQRPEKSHKSSPCAAITPLQSELRWLQAKGDPTVAGRAEKDVDSWLSPANLAPLWQPSLHLERLNHDLDMRLLWFYTAETSSSFSTSKGSQDPVDLVMRTQVVQLGFQSPYLMQAILGLSALHLQSLGQDIDPNRSLYYRASSLEGYRTAVERADPKDHTSLVTNSLLLTALTSQTFRDPNGKDLYIIDWMIIWRGVHILINTVGRRDLMESGLSELFYRPPFDIGRAVYAIPDDLLSMVSSITTDDEDYADIQTYYDALRYIGALYHSLRYGLGPKMHLFAITWLTFIPQRFVELSSQRRPRALVILAYYAVFLKLNDVTWWAKGIGQRTITDIIRHLNPEWSSLLRIPTRAKAVDDPTELIGMILGDSKWPVSKDILSAEEDMFRTDDSVQGLSWVDNRGRAVKVEGDAVILAHSGDEAIFHV